MAFLTVNSLCQCVCMAVLTSAAARAAKSFWGADGLDDDDLIGIIVGFCMITLFSNLCGVRVSRICRFSICT